MFRFTSENLGMFRFTYELVREAYQVARPSMGLVTSSLYLYKNPDPSVWMALYFAFIFQMGCNAGNDYMDWERDMAEKGREFSVSRGKARSKQFVWYYYMFASSVAIFVAYLDPFQGLLYFFITEIAGQLMYNGLFCGFAVHELSIVKSVGFPLDVIVACWTYMPYAQLAGHRRWFPTWTISAWGTTMLWAQLKDYEHEKNTKVKTTATVLGPNACRVLICAAATVMMYGDYRFFMYGIYTFYRCWYPVITGKEGKLKMSVIMALNLVLITIFDEELDSRIKWTCYLAQVFAFLLYKASYALEQKYYAILAILNRHKAYDPKVWDEKDPDILLWKVGGLIGRSGSAVMGLFSTGMARLCLMGYIVFRTQDTWADVAIGKESRIKGLGLLPKRYQALEESDGLIKEDDVKDVKWNLETRERNRLYVDVTKNVHRFDAVYKRMKPLHRQILREYAEDVGKGWSELELRKDDPVTPELMRKHAEVALDAGFFGMCKGMSPALLKQIRTDEFEPKTHKAYISFSDYIWYLNLAASIEEDVAEGLALDDDLRAMDGLDKEVVDRVRVRWLIHAIEELLKSNKFLFHPALSKCWTLRLFILQFFQTSVNVCEKYFVLLKDAKYEKKVGGSAIVKTFIQSWTEKGYHEAVDGALRHSAYLLEELKLYKDTTSRKM